MARYELTGEGILDALPLERADAQEFCGVVVYRLWGTKDGIMQSTDMLQGVYPGDDFSTLTDAVWIGHIKASPGDKSWVDLYELIVMRGVRK